MLQGDRLALRPLEAEELPQLLRWLQTGEVSKYLVGEPPSSLPELERWYAAPGERFTVMHRVGRQKPRAIGVVELGELSQRHQRCRLSVIIGEHNQWGKGLGGEAARLAISYGFHTANLRRIELWVADYNAQARRCFEKVGFRYEGTLRQAHFHDGQFRDVEIYALLRSEA